MTDVDGKILVVDDDASLAEMLQIVLRAEGFATAWCARGDRALDAFHAEKPDLVLLDLMLPGRGGVEICRAIRAESGVPIVMLTAKSDTSDVVKGLEAGADDYIAKPFAPRELVARVRTRLRKVAPSGVETLSIRDLEIGIESHQVIKAGQLVPVTPLEFDLLLTLARHPKHVFTREQLLKQVWGYQNPADTRLVNVHIQRLRAKIEQDPDNPEIVLTVRGVGYRASA
ncbi:MAG: response regulator transcription factor [Propionibacteriaceae bacterium]|jgi:two-component system response regulator MtrA|nr:response regulator transcription factor [Propionibacteriaceae bacterium]